MGTMDQAALVADLKASLHDSASAFTAANDADFKRHLDVAALDLGRLRPRTLLGSVALVADQETYAAPADLLQFKASLWGTAERRIRRQWDKNWPGPLPTCRAVEDATGRVLHLMPAPTAAQITDLGATYKFYYFAGHTIGATAAETSVLAGDRGLLILRAQAEAMRELAMHQVNKPVKVVPGTGGTPREGTPAVLARQLMIEFEAAR